MWLIGLSEIRLSSNDNKFVYSGAVRYHGPYSATDGKLPRWFLTITVYILNGIRKYVSVLLRSRNPEVDGSTMHVGEGSCVVALKSVCFRVTIVDRPRIVLRSANCGGREETTDGIAGDFSRYRRRPDGWPFTDTVNRPWITASSVALTFRSPCHCLGPRFEPFGSPYFPCRPCTPCLRSLLLPLVGWLAFPIFFRFSAERSEQ